MHLRFILFQAGRFWAGNKLISETQLVFSCIVTSELSNLKVIVLSILICGMGVAGSYTVDM